MYLKKKIALVIPSYNEERLIIKTAETMPDFVDYMFLVNDGSTDNTLEVIKELARKDKRVIVMDNEKNLGVGGSLVRGFREALKVGADIIGVMAGDAQCDPSYIAPMLDTLIKGKLDYVKANRFVHREALKQMPTYRRIGNIIITILTKFSTGYYSIFDTQNGYGFYTREIMEKMSLDLIGQRYDYENTALIALSIAGAKIKDVPVPAIYGDEVSTIPVFKTTMRALSAIWKGFWRRIYYKYVAFNFHPIALFLFSGLLFSVIGLLFGLFAVYEKAVHDLTPSTGTIMLVIIPLILGFQLLLTAFTLDMRNEGRR